MASKKQPPLNKAAQARRNVESKALNQSMGKIKTGPHTPKPKAGTRTVNKSNAIKESKNG